MSSAITSTTAPVVTITSNLQTDKRGMIPVSTVRQFNDELLEKALIESIKVCKTVNREILGELHSAMTELKKAPSMNAKNFEVLRKSIEDRKMFTFSNFHLVNALHQGLAQTANLNPYVEHTEDVKQLKETQEIIIKSYLDFMNTARKTGVLVEFRGNGYGGGYFTTDPKGKQEAERLTGAKL